MEFHHYNKSKSVVVWLHCIYCIIFLGASITMMVIILCHILPNAELPIEFILVAISFCCFTALYSIDLILWQITGKEDLIITNNEICVRHYGRIFNKKQTIKITDITCVTERSYLKHGENNFWYPSKQGSIKIECNKKIFYIGRNIDTHETNRLIEIILQYKKVNQSILLNQ